MPQLTAMDELFVHQLPEPMSNVAVHHQHWRESLFFVMHPRDRIDDVVILTMATFPARGELDALQLGHIGGSPLGARHHRPANGDPHTLEVGAARVDIVEPFKKIELHVGESPTTSAALDVTFTARTPVYGLRRGTMKAGHEIIWDQSHLVQSGVFNGQVTRGGTTYDINDWWGQRDHSWGIRDHGRCPFWMWLAIQLPDGMLSLWHWELPNGARVYTDGCWSPADGGEPVPVIDAHHDLHWVNSDDKEVDYGRDGEDVAGVAGHVDLTLQGGQVIALDADGLWAQRYGPVGGGLNLCHVRTGDGREGTGIYELTGAYHHRYFPVARGERLPPDGR
jgi:hypothetical protein